MDHRPLLKATSISWQTNLDILCRSAAVMGAIDVDPCAGRNTQIGAQANFRLPRDGLQENWLVCGQGTRIFVNPPFGNSYIRGDQCISAEQRKALPLDEQKQFRSQTVAKWAAKMVDAIKNGGEGIWLSKANLESVAFQAQLFPVTASICLPRRRISYVDPDTGVEQQGATFSSVLVYMGDRAKRFEEVFQDLGTCFRRSGEVV